MIFIINFDIMCETKDRVLALQRWNALTKDEQQLMWENYKKYNFTPSNNPSELTGREIEKILKIEDNIKKFKEFSDKVSDDDIIIDDDMDCMPTEYFKPNNN